jgi:hypothetical protein
MTVIEWLARTVRLPNGLLLIFSELFSIGSVSENFLYIVIHSNRSASGCNASEQRIGFEWQDAILLPRVDRASENP